MGVTAQRLLVLAAALAVAAPAAGCRGGGADAPVAPPATAPTAADEATSAGVPTVMVLDWYGQIRGDACERFEAGDTSPPDGAPAGATSPLNAGPPAPEDEAARPAIDELPVPSSWTLIDERTTSSLDEPAAHGIQRTWCIPRTATDAEVASVLGWARAHGRLVGVDGVPVDLVAGAYPDDWRMLWASARLHPPRMDVRALDVRVRWAAGVLPAAAPGSSPAVHVRLECAPTPRRVIVRDTRPRRRAASPDAAALCASLDATPGLVLPGGSVAHCDPGDAIQLTVAVRGTWDGEPVELRHRSCDAPAPSVARRWVEAVGLAAPAG